MVYILNLWESHPNCIFRVTIFLPNKSANQLIQESRAIAMRQRYFQCCRTLRLWNLKKWGQYYYIVLLSPLSPFHWPQNNVTKLFRATCSEAGMFKWGLLLGKVRPWNLGGQKTSKIRRDFWQLSSLIANISGTDPHVENRLTKSPASSGRLPHFGAVSRSPAASLKSPAFLFCRLIKC